MPPSKAANAWDDSDEDSTPPSSPPTAATTIARRGKFDDEEDDSDVLDSWDAAEDSEVEREKAKKAAEAKAAADAAAKASHKSKSQRIEEKRQETLRRRQMEEEESSSEEEDESERLARMREEEKKGDLKHAEDLFGGAGTGPAKRTTLKPAVVQAGDDPTQTVDLNSLKLFEPSTVQQFATLRDTLIPPLMKNSKKPQYPSFLQEFSKQLGRDLNSDQLKKISSQFATMSNEKLKEEKAADKTGKKTKAAKTKVTLSANRDVSSRADTTLYDEDGLDE